MHFLLAFLLLLTCPKQVPKQIQRELRGDRLKGSIFSTADSGVAVHGNRISGRARVTSHSELGRDSSQPDVVPKTASTPTDPFYERNDIREAAAKAWGQARGGTGGAESHTAIEAGFRVDQRGESISVVPHEITNQRGEISWEKSPTTVAEFHVHPNRSLPQPSENDKKLANSHGIDIYTIHQNGVYAYRPSRKVTEFLGPLEEFIGKKKPKAK
ncbi:MAG: hypothetical protein JWQ87_2009 [Candidatus Sulfotelmatobacter sp.]|nr:hypothetical protein [Candidatus Sulfotelmatobacter sp.]